MEKFEVSILGCGCALPTTHHVPSSQVVNVREKLFMVDCGEGTQLQLRRMHINFQKLQAVFISHLHGDHCFGLLGMLSTFALLDRTAPLHVYAHADLERILRPQMEYYGHAFTYGVHFHAIDPSQAAVIYDDRSLQVSTLPLNHRVPCCGFLFREKPTLPHIRRDMIDFYRIPRFAINAIKQGADWETPGGERVPWRRLTRPAEPPRSYAYCSDTAPMPGLAGRLRDVTLLYHEATYCEDRADKAAQHMHSTARQAALVAREAGVGRLLLGHFSRRYDDDGAFLREAQAVFPATLLAAEGQTICV
ncbi:MAG: ribonuclease Z [Alloprevotella sp.]|nr:ribonuclease Z [Alloprevotella sp.]